MTLNDPMKKAQVVTGMLRPIPRIWLTSVLFVAT